MSARASADRSWLGLAALLLLAAGLVACAPRSTRVTLPSGAGTPLTPVEAQALADAVMAACDDEAALTADVRVGGQVDGERIRGTLQLGVDVAALRIEGVPPFGAPLFVLAGRTDAATLWLPRENAYVSDVPVAQLTDALIGLPLAPADLRMLLAGCGIPVHGVRGGATYGTWTRLDAADGARVWVTRRPEDGPAGAAVVRVADTAGWRLDYAEREADGPVRGTLVASGTEARTQLSFEVVAPERLLVLPPAALDVVIPAGARPVPLADLRRQRVLAAS